MTPLRLLALVVASGLPLVAHARPMSIDRPSVAPSSGVMDRQRLQLELGPVFGGATVPLAVAVRFGLADEIELRLSSDVLSFGVASVKGPTQVLGGLKWRAARSDDAALSAVLHAAFDVARQSFGWDAAFVLSLLLPSDFLSWAYLQLSTPTFLSLATPRVVGALGFGHDLLSAQNLAAFVELSFTWAAPAGALLPSAMLGLGWGVQDNLRLDAWIMPTFTTGARIASTVGGVGVTVRI